MHSTTQRPDVNECLVLWGWRNNCKWGNICKE